MALEIIDEIQKQIQKGNNFLVSGGAGSGKTYSLMEVIDLIYSPVIENIRCKKRFFVNTVISNIIKV
jgi:ABC-type microcin C transport system duplicated ATPase subunit YejF